MKDARNDINDIVLVFMLLTLDRFHTLLSCFIETIKYRLEPTGSKQECTDLTNILPYKIFKKSFQSVITNDPSI